MTTRQANHSNYAVTLTVDQPAQDVFAAVNDPRGWWSQAIVGETDQLDAVFYYHYKNIHRCTLQITELVPDRKVVWRVLHNDFNFIHDRSEWNDTDIVFEIAAKGDRTEVRFTHHGLVPAYECYDVCSNAWGNYITGSLRSLIATGEGQPNPMNDHAQHQEAIVTKVREMSRHLEP
jgi:Activator of Hsp90 ATPase homolog 1-like protein